MRAAALSRLITLMLMVGPAAFAAPLNPPVSAPAPANGVEDTVNQRAPNVGDAPVSNVAENATLPQEEVEANRGAVRVTQQGVSATFKVLGTQDPGVPLNACLIVVGRTPGEVIDTPSGPKVANIRGQVFGDCQLDEDQDPDFTPGFINLADSDPNAGDNSGDTGNGSGNDVSTADEPPASNDSAPPPSGDTTDAAPTSDDAQDSGDAPSTDGQDTSPASGDDQDQAPPADDEQPQTTTGNQHATQPGAESFPAGTFEEGVSRLAQITPNGIPPNGVPPSGFPPSGFPPNRIPANGIPPNGFPPSAEGAASRASQPFPNGPPSAEQLSPFSPFSNFPPSGNIHAPSAPSYTDAPFDSSAPPAGAIQAAQDVSPDDASAPTDASSVPFGVVNLADSQLPKPAISANVEAKPLGDDC